MQLDPNDLLLFARVAESGSFTSAAERLGLPKSTVSRRLSVLERELGERLMLRTTRKLTLTDFGRAVLDHARQLALEVDAAASLALHRQAQPSGRLRVSVPSDFAVQEFTEVVSEFLQRYPAISLELDMSARRVDLVGENFDLAIRMGDLPDDATLTARRMFGQTWGLYAAPHYLALRGTPREPADLAGHDGLSLRSRQGDAVSWVLQQGSQRWEGLPPLRASVNSPDMLRRLAARGAGIAGLPDVHARPAVQAGHLVRVLPGWQLPEVAAWAVLPSRRLVPARTRVFLEMLEARLLPGLATG